MPRLPKLGTPCQVRLAHLSWGCACGQQGHEELRCVLLIHSKAGPVLILGAVVPVLVHLIINFAQAGSG